MKVENVLGESNFYPVVLLSPDVELPRPGQRIETIFRYGAHFESNSRYGDPAYQIDLYQRNSP